MESFIKKILLALFVFIFAFSCSSSDEETCDKPLNFSLQTTDENFAFFNYTKEEVFSSSIIEYGEPGFEVGVNAIGVSHKFSNPLYEGIGSDYKNHLVTNVMPNTTYEAYIKSECSTNIYSEYIGPVLFTTLAFGEGCTRPDSLVALEKTNSTILIDWEGYNKENWAVDISFTGINGVWEYVYLEISEKPFLIEDLMPETEYNITVSTNYCGDVIESSLPSNEITVITN